METVMQTATAKRVRSVRPVGTRAVLAELNSLQDVLALQDMLYKSPPLPGQVDVLAAAETVMVVGESAAATRAIGARLLELELAPLIASDSGLVVIDTVYDGDDLADVAELTGLSVDGVIAAHTGQIWTVAFAGFAPGFGYMVGENEALTVPPPLFTAHGGARRIRGSRWTILRRLPTPFSGRLAVDRPDRGPDVGSGPFPTCIGSSWRSRAVPGRPRSGDS